MLLEFIVYYNISFVKKNVIIICNKESFMISSNLILQLKTVDCVGQEL